MNTKYYATGFSLLLIYMLPYIVLGENAYITIHDYLDQEVAIMATLKNADLMACITGIVPNMEGLSRTLFESFTPFNVKLLCYFFLPTYWAIFAYTYLLKCVAFVGLFLLVDNYLLDQKHRWITMGLALGLAIVPSYILHELSGIGLPLLIYGFLNLYNSKQMVLSYLLIVFYAFNSMLAYGGFFALSILFVILCYDWYKNKRICKRMIYGMVLMCIVYIIANIGTIYSMFFSSSFVSHRSEWVVASTIKEDLLDYIKLLLISNYHAGRLLAAPIIFIFGCLILKYRNRYHYLNGIAALYVLIISGILVGKLLRYTHIQLFVEIQFDRFYFFYPAICFIMLAASCSVLLKEGKAKLAFIAMLIGLFAPLCFDNELRANAKQVVGNELKEPNYREFYDTKLFSDIMEALNVKPDYITKVVSVGMFPAVAEYNGFYTLDSYRVNYPVIYKHKFRNVISRELDKNETLRQYFDSWGSRCYVFSSELDLQGNRYLCSKKDKMVLEHLDIDTQILKELGCEYILSAVDIGNYKELNLDYINSFTTEESYWNIRVYKLI